MKRLNSSDDVNSSGEKGVFKDCTRKDEDLSLRRSSSHRGFYYKSGSGKKGTSSSSSRYDRSEDGESSRLARKRPDYVVENYDRRKSYDRYREGDERVMLSSSPRGGGYSSDRIHRSESFSGPRREFPKGFRSERDRSRREGSVSSWWRFSGAKDVDEGSRSACDSAGRNIAGSEDLGKIRSPQGPREAKSPAWSKDSGSEQSKSIEFKKGESLPVESGNSSEMEEGELEPDPEPAMPVVELTAEGKASVPLNTNQEFRDGNPDEDKHLEDVGASMPKEIILPDITCVHAEKTTVEQLETAHDLMKTINKLSNCQNSSVNDTGDSGVAVRLSADNEGNKDEVSPKDSDKCKADACDKLTVKSQPMEEDKGDDIHPHGSVESTADGKGVSEGTKQYLLTKELTHNFKDKAKGVAVSPSNGADSLNASLRNENTSGGLLSCKGDNMAGPSTRGFELFFPDPVKKPDSVDQESVSKQTNELAFEPLELSLSLPNVLLHIGAQKTVQDPGSPSHDTSIQSLASSFKTSSDGFTMSKSFSGSQHFTHNPSCSLTQNSFDFEQSVGSHPLFQPVDQVNPASRHVLTLDEQKNGDFSIYPRSLPNGNDIFNHTQSSHGISNGHVVQVQSLRVAEASSRVPLGFEGQLNINNKLLSAAHSRHMNDIRSPSQSAGSQEPGPEYFRERKRSMRENDGVLSMSNTIDEKQKKLAVAAPNLVEPLITMVVSEPLHAMARKFNEMTAHSVSCIKEFVRDVLLNSSNRRQLFAFQKALENRADITMEMLQKSHRAQLEILVSLKTGDQEFLQRNYDIPSSDLAEIFLNLRCRNLTCRSYLPVDECDCKICAQKNGFCSACMCLVCSKFDMASNTCSWVGCDVCLHWCHTGCGLRESYIRNGHSATAAQTKTEMQFHCVACGHPSEMFGFVKEVFQNFAKWWTAETLTKELEYVRRIFFGSEDVRGKRLHEITVQMLSRLANKVDPQEVKNHITGFLTDNNESFKPGCSLISRGKELPEKNQVEGNNDGVSEEAIWMKAVYSENPSKLVKPSALPVGYDYDRNHNKHTVSSDLHRIGTREPVFDELDSIVRIKEAEANMFQTRADEARKEADGLQCIANAKNKRIDEEFVSRITKLHLAEAELIRRQKFEELQALERAHQEYFNMKVRMEADIKDLLLKMEGTKRNFSL